MLVRVCGRIPTLIECTTPGWDIGVTSCSPHLRECRTWKTEFMQNGELTFVSRGFMVKVTYVNDVLRRDFVIAVTGMFLE